MMGEVPISEENKNVEEICLTKNAANTCKNTTPFEVTRNGEDEEKPLMDLEHEQKDDEQTAEELDSGDVEEDERHEDDDKEEADEAEKPRVCVDPGRPSRKEIEEHEVTHMPFRSWWPHCVRGRGQATPHPKGRDKRELQFPTGLC